MLHATVSNDRGARALPVRHRVAGERTTLNEQFRRWLADYVGRKQQAAEAVHVMRELEGRLQVGRRLTREEVNER